MGIGGPNRENNMDMKRKLASDRGYMQRHRHVETEMVIKFV